MNRLTYAYKLIVYVLPFNMSWETINVRPYNLHYFLIQGSTIPLVYIFLKKF